MHRATRHIGAWLSTIALAAAVLIALTVRGSLGSATPSMAPSALGPTAGAAAVRGVVLGDDAANEALSPPRRPAPPPTPEPTPEPTPAPPPPTAVPTLAPAPTQPPASDGAGGGLAPRTAPPGWTPPATIPGDIWTTGSFGQTLSAGGITVTTTRLPLDTDPTSCADGNPLPDGYAWVGFLVTTTWSGFSLPVYSADAPEQGLVTCWIGDPPPMTSGVTYQVFKQLPHSVASTTLLRVSYFPNGASPAYVFEFR